MTFTPLSALRKCALCKTAMYCSKECQTQSWKTVHKAECKELVQQQRESGESFHRSEHIYRLTIAFRAF